MPFPLAHPAAVLPFRRYCPRYFNFPALIIGSIVPDLGYFFVSRHLDKLTHRLLGSFVFSLPVGLILLGLFYTLRSTAIRLLPDRFQRLYQPFCQRSSGPLLVSLFSLLIGSWTHLVWDSFTHQDGWVVRHCSPLQYPLAMVAGRTLRVCHLLWYTCSFVGVVWILMLYLRWQRAATGCASPVSSRSDLVFASLVALFLLPIELVHHLLLGGLGLLLAGIATFLILLVTLRGIGHHLPQSSLEKASALGRGEGSLATDLRDSEHS